MFQKLLNVIPVLLLLNAAFIFLIQYGFTYQPNLVSNADKYISNAFRKPYLDKAEKISLVSETDPDLAYELAFQLNSELNDTKFGEYLWTAKRRSLIYMATYLYDNKEYNKAVKVLDEWEKIHSRDLDLLNLQVTVYAHVVERRASLIKLLRERAHRLSKVEYVKAYIDELLANDQFKLASVRLIQFLISKDEWSFEPWRIYLRGSAGFTEGGAQDAIWKQDAAGKQTATVTLPPDTKFVRCDPVSNSFVLSSVNLDVIVGDEVVETIQLSSEFNPSLHQIKYGELYNSYLIDDVQDPYFILPLKQQVPNGATLKITLTPWYETSIWVESVLALIPSKAILEASASHHWEYSSQNSLKIKSYVERYADAATF